MDICGVDGEGGKRPVSSCHLAPWLELEPMRTQCPWEGKIGWPQVLKYGRPHLSQSALSGVTLGFPHESDDGRWKQCSVLLGSHWLSLQAVALWLSGLLYLGTWKCLQKSPFLPRKTLGLSRVTKFSFPIAGSRWRISSWTRFPGRCWLSLSIPLVSLIQSIKT